VACDRDLFTARNHEEGSGTLDAMIRGEKLLAPDHRCGAQQVMPHQLDNVAADSACRTAAHYRLCFVETKKKGG
jgi:hypothetical protein